MKYKEQLQQEMEQAQLQLQKLDELEQKNEATQADKQPTAETTNAEAGSTSNNPNQQGNATEFVKNGNDIQVTNPEVVIDQSKGTGKYQGFTVEYKNVNFPDDMAINQGDKVTFNLPEEINFQTKYEFDVKIQRMLWLARLLLILKIVL